MGQRKSEHYNWFNSSNNPKHKTPKQRAKFSWKIFKIFIYVALFGLSLTGCVQSFVIQNDTKTGSGLEFYNNENEVSPHVVSIKEASQIYDSPSDPQTVLTLSKENYWVQDKEVLAQLKTQEPNIGAWKSKTQALRVENSDDQGALVKSSAGRFFIDNDVNNSAESYEYNMPDSTKLPWIEFNDKTTNLQNLILKDAVWPAGATDVEFKSDKTLADFKNSPAQEKISTNASTKDGRFALDSYGYLTQKYLLNETTQMPTPVSGEKISDKDKAWISNYASIGGITGWAYRTDVTTPSNSGFNYMAGSLSFNATKEQRAIYSWGGSWGLGPFYGLFVYPLAWLTGAILNGMPQIQGWEAIIAIFLVVLIVRGIAYAFSFKSALQTVKQQEVQGKVAIINAKYEPYKGNKQMDRRKQQEVSELYKKEGVSIFGSFSQIFITMPLFLSMWRVIGAMPSLKSTTWLGINFAATSYSELFQGAWQYLPLMLLSAFIQGFSQITPRLFTKRREKNRSNIYQQKAMKKSNKTQNIMIGVFVFMALILSAGLEVYWIFSGLFTIAQNTVNHYIIKHQSIKHKRKPAY